MRYLKKIYEFLNTNQSITSGEILSKVKPIFEEILESSDFMMDYDPDLQISSIRDIDCSDLVTSSVDRDIYAIEDDNYKLLEFKFFLPERMTDDVMNSAHRLCKEVYTMLKVEMPSTNFIIYPEIKGGYRQVFFYIYTLEEYVYLSYISEFANLLDDQITYDIGELGVDIVSLGYEKGEDVIDITLISPEDGKSKFSIKFYFGKNFTPKVDSNGNLIFEYVVRTISPYEIVKQDSLTIDMNYTMKYCKENIRDINAINKYIESDVIKNDELNNKILYIFKPYILETSIRSVISNIVFDLLSEEFGQYLNSDDILLERGDVSFILHTKSESYTIHIKSDDAFKTIKITCDEVNNVSMNSDTDGLKDDLLVFLMDLNINKNSFN